MHIYFKDFTNAVLKTHNNKPTLKKVKQKLKKF